MYNIELGFTQYSFDVSQVSTCDIEALRLQAIVTGVVGFLHM